MRALFLAFSLILTAAGHAPALDRTPSSCLALAEGEARLQTAGFGAEVTQGSVLIRYLDHASFAIVTDEGQLAVTDYTGFLGNPDIVPDVVTMNNAHETHFTDQPDPRIGKVLRGWSQGDVPPRIRVDLGSLMVRNVTTDLRGPFGEGARRDGNSVFVFEASGLCIVHLSHLHQVPNAAQLGAIGRVDVVMVPVDGAYTMDAATMAGVIKAMHPRVVLPMHWFSAEGLQAFVSAMGPEFGAEIRQGPDLVLSRAALPSPGRVIVLNPAFLP